MSLSIIMPIVVLGLSFALKMFIDRSTTVNDAICSALELPVDIAFLSISLIVGLTLTPNVDPQQGLAWFGFYICGAIIIVFIWRRSTNIHINSGNFFWLGLLNYLISITGLVFSIKLLTGGTQ